jgi:hypothetical protein
MLARVVKDGIGFVDTSIYTPQDPTPRQKLFLELDNQLEVFYGGAAGGGKSSALLMAALKYVHIPGYAALLLRRSYTDLALPGALMDRAHQWLHGKAHWSGMEKKWTFPSGASLTFGYLANENDKYQYQSSEFQFIGFDELSQFTETQYTYLFSRLRRLRDSNIPLRLRSGSNPGGVGGFWVRDRFIPDDFTPDLAIEERVFTKHGIDDETGDTIDRFFVPARLDDNPHLDQAQYELSLRNLDPVTRAQLRRGDWQITLRGDILYMWDESQVVVPWSRFRALLNLSQNEIPAHWRVGVFQDWGTTKDHPMITGWFATAAENAPTINGVDLKESVFLYRMLVETQCTARDVKKRLYEEMLTHSEIGRCYMWQMSHEASSERLEYLNANDDLGYSLPFSAWETGKTRGIEQLKYAISPRELDKPHPFNTGIKGHPKLFILVEDTQIMSPSTVMSGIDYGMSRVRQEAPAYKWDVPKSGDPPRTLVPYALFNDAMDVLRAAAASYWPRMEEFSVDELLVMETNKLLGPELQARISQKETLTEGQQMTLLHASRMALAKMQKEGFLDEFGLEPEEGELSDLSGGW